MMPPWTDAEACGCCGKKAYGTETFHYLETWGEHTVEGGWVSVLRKKRLLCAKCGEAALKAVAPMVVATGRNIGICTCGHSIDAHTLSCVAIIEYEDRPDEVCGCSGFIQEGTLT